MLRKIYKSEAGGWRTNEVVVFAPLGGKERTTILRFAQDKLRGCPYGALGGRMSHK
jgi:hypothetical protein